MKSRIFISYRRHDTENEAGRLLTSIQRELPAADVFMDTSSLPAGSVWPDAVREALTSATAVVVLIGPDWLRAGSDDWGRRPIDRTDDWVRLEVEQAIATSTRLLPILVRGAQIPPADVLPEPMRPLTHRQALEIRAAYWDHDVKLLFRQIAETDQSPGDDEAFEVFPRFKTDETAESIDEGKLSKALQGSLRGWVRVETPDSTATDGIRVELFREYRFESFKDTMAFMAQVAPGCDIANHHPRWENIWRTLRVFLTTWNLGHRVSDRDVQLAKYFDAAYQEFDGRARTTGLGTSAT